MVFNPKTSPRLIPSIQLIQSTAMGVTHLRQLQEILLVQGVLQSSFAALQRRRRSEGAVMGANMAMRLLFFVFLEAFGPHNLGCTPKNTKFGCTSMGHGKRGVFKAIPARAHAQRVTIGVYLEAFRSMLKQSGRFSVVP